MQLNVPFDLVGNAALSLAPMVAPHIGHRSLKLGLGAVQQIDASGIALLMRVRSHLARFGGELKLVDVRESLMQELRRIGLSSLLVAEVREAGHAYTGSTSVIISIGA